MKITGQILKENRERKGTTLNEVSLSTKITIKTLMAIEQGDPLNLPPKTFLRGFVRSYAVFLGLDVEEILRTFQEEMGSTLSRPVGAGPNPSELNAAATEEAAIDPATPGTATATGKDSGREAPALEKAAARSTKKIDAEATLRDEPSIMTKGGIVGGILLLIILIVFLKGKMDSYESERTTGPADPASVETAAPLSNAPLTAAEKSESAAAPASTTDSDERQDGAVAPTVAPSPSASPVAASPTPAPSPTATAAPTASPSPTATPKPSPSPTATPKPSPTATPTPSPSPKPSPSPTATPKPSPSPTATPAAAKPSPTPATAPAAAAGKSHEILIEALDQVDVEVTVDGEAARTIKLRGEQVQSIKVKRKAILKLSDGGAVNIIVNGVDRGVPGDLGKPARVELP